MEWVAPVLTLVGLIVGPIITWKIAKRKSSGSISTSEAVDLWAESNRLREDYKNQAATNLARAERAEEQIRKNNEQLVAVNAKLSEVMREFTTFKENADKNSEAMRKKIDELKSIIKKLQSQNKRLLAHKEGATA